MAREILVRCVQLRDYVAPTALRSIFRPCTQPFRAGLSVCRAYGAGVLRSKHVRSGIQSFDDKKIRRSDYAVAACRILNFSLRS